MLNKPRKLSQLLDTTTVVSNVRRAGALIDVRIHRPTIFGNPFHIGRDGDRLMVVQKFKEWIEGKRYTPFATKKMRATLIAGLPPLRGKILGCFCYPLACHGNVLAYMLNHMTDKEILAFNANPFTLDV